MSLVAASEREGAQTEVRSTAGYRTAVREPEHSGMELGRPTRQGESPVREMGRQQAGSGVPRDT